MDKIVQEVEKLNLDSRTVKTAHYLAFQKKQIKHKIVGGCIIIINIIILSPLIELLTLKYTVIFVRVLAIVSASLAAFQTFFNYQKEIELHLSAGEAYTRVYRKSRFLLSKYTDKLIEKDGFLKESEELLQDYLNAYNTYKSCIPSNKDYDDAVKSNEKRTKK